MSVLFVYVEALQADLIARALKSTLGKHDENRSIYQTGDDRDNSVRVVQAGAFMMGSRFHTIFVQDPHGHARIVQRPHEGEGVGEARLKRYLDYVDMELRLKLVPGGKLYWF